MDFFCLVLCDREKRQGSINCVQMLFKNHGKGEILEGVFVEGLGFPTIGSGL